MTPTLTPTQLQFLASMLPEDIHSDDRPHRLYDFYWRERSIGRGRGVEITDWNFLVSLAEAKLREEERPKYMDQLFCEYEPNHHNMNWCDLDPHSDWFVIATFPPAQRITAMAKVLNKELL